MKAVVLLSGGLDSTTCLAKAAHDGRECYALTIRYGQRHRCELAAARAVAARFRVTEHRFASVDLGQFGASALTSPDIEVPKGDSAPNPDAESNEIPVTYVPARNTVFLSIALAWAEVLEADEIWLGVNAVDYSGYPDCRPEFLRAFENLAALATKVGVAGRGAPRIVAPLVELTKARIVQLGLSLGVDYAMTSTCYDPSESGVPCRSCEACRLRERGFAEAGQLDPLVEFGPRYALPEQDSR
ncbi:MAG: 7-cyano-7-deazaguanine synthase QueC [Planctomycetes bacterium]|nr:7-cyano-7-deazaguanine synthase QueC [Planctomycetota bacterium]